MRSYLALISYRMFALVQSNVVPPIQRHSWRCVIPSTANLATMRPPAVQSQSQSASSLSVKTNSTVPVSDNPQQVNRVGLGFGDKLALALTGAAVSKCACGRTKSH